MISVPVYRNDVQMGLNNQSKTAENINNSIDYNNSQHYKI